MHRYRVIIRDGYRYNSLYISRIVRATNEDAALSAVLAEFTTLLPDHILSTVTEL